MKFPSKKKKSQLIDPILPLINVVFLLLIFVMIMSRVEGTDSFEVAPPVSTSDEPAGQRESLLVLTSTGELHLDGQTLEKDDLMAFAKQYAADQNAQELKIKADAKVDAMELISLMENLRMAGLENLVLLTEKRN